MLELPAPGDGVLVEVVKPDGATVTSNEVIAVIDTEAKARRGAAQRSGSPKATEPATRGEAAARAAPPQTRCRRRTPTRRAQSRSPTHCPRHAR